MKTEWATFGGRLRYARKTHARITQKQAAAYLRSKGHDVSTKLIGYWETIEEPSHKRGRRIFYPSEILSLIEFYQINGLWLYMYERTPSLSIHPPENGESALFGRPAPITLIDKDINQRIERLSSAQKKQFISILKLLGTD